MLALGRSTLVVMAGSFLCCCALVEFPEAPAHTEGRGGSSGTGSIWGPHGLSVATGPDGLRLAAGTFEGSIDLLETIDAVESQEGFLLALDKKGNRKWGVTFSGSSAGTVVAGVSSDRGGSALVTGLLEGEVKFAGESVESKGWKDGFVAKYGPAGDFVGVRIFGGLAGSGETGSRVVTDRLGYVVLTGVFSGSADIGAATGTMYYSEPEPDAFGAAEFVGRITL